MNSVQIERRKRGIFGWIVLSAFWLFNLFMLTTCAVGMSNVAQVSENATSDAERAGAAIGTTLGLGMILTLWFFGAGVLGLMVLFTRGQKTIETIHETSNGGRQEAQNESPKSNLQGTADISAELSKLGKLKADGVLSDQEFNQLKAKLIGN